MVSMITVVVNMIVIKLWTQPYVNESIVVVIVNASVVVVAVKTLYFDYAQWLTNIGLIMTNKYQKWTKIVQILQELHGKKYICKYDYIIVSTKI